MYPQDKLIFLYVIGLQFSTLSLFDHFLIKYFNFQLLGLSLNFFKISILIINHLDYNIIFYIKIYILNFYVLNLKSYTPKPYFYSEKIL